MDRTDDELIEEYINGSSLAFDRLLARYKGMLFGFIYNTIGRAEAEDIFQETFLKVIKNIKRYKKRGSFKSYLFTIANHLMIDRMRYAGLRKVVSLDAEFKSEGSLKDIIPSATPGPDKLAENNELKVNLEEAVNRLPFVQRQALMMREHSGLSFKEIAEILKCPLNTAIGRVHYGLKSLRKEFSKEWGDSKWTAKT